MGWKDGSAGGQPGGVQQQPGFGNHPGPVPQVGGFLGQPGGVVHPNTSFAPANGLPPGVAPPRYMGDSGGGPAPVPGMGGGGMDGGQGGAAPYAGATGGYSGGDEPPGEYGPNGNFVPAGTGGYRPPFSADPGLSAGNAMLDPLAAGQGYTTVAGPGGYRAQAPNGIGAATAGVGRAFARQQQQPGLFNQGADGMKAPNMRDHGMMPAPTDAQRNALQQQQVARAGDPNATHPTPVAPAGGFGTQSAPPGPAAPGMYWKTGPNGEPVQAPLTDLSNGAR